MPVEESDKAGTPQASVRDDKSYAPSEPSEHPITDHESHVEEVKQPSPPPSDHHSEVPPVEIAESVTSKQSKAASVVPTPEQSIREPTPPKVEEPEQPVKQKTPTPKKEKEPEVVIKPVAEEVKQVPKKETPKQKVEAPVKAPTPPQPKEKTPPMKVEP